MKKYIYDVFIAYHGTYSSDGTYDYAKDLAKHLKNVGIIPYVFEEGGSEDWTDTIRHIQESKCMLVLVNDNIYTDEYGRIRKTRPNCEPYQLYEEIETFRSLVNAGQVNRQTINFIYYGDKRKSEDEVRHFLMSLVVDIGQRLNDVIGTFTNPEVVVKWVQKAVVIALDEKIEKVTIDINDIVKQITDNLMRRECAVVIGPLLNDNYSNFRPDDKSGNFFTKCHKLRHEKGDIALRRELETLSRHPVHKNIHHIAKLPFTSYLTTVEYTQIDAGLVEAEKEPVLITDSSSIYGLDLQKGEIPVFEFKRTELHLDDCVMPEGLIYDILKMILTGKKVIYLGYGEDYKGYIAISNALKKILGSDYTIQNNIVVLKSNGMPTIYDDVSNELRIINLNVEDFLGRLITSKNFSKSFRYNADDSKFITDLFNIASTPTETQAIELFLSQLLDDLNRNDLELVEIISKADSNCNNLKRIKRNFNAFEKCWLSIKSDLFSNPTRRKLKKIVEDYKWERHQVTNGIKEQGEDFSENESGRSILLFSESLRAIEFLSGTTDSFQKQSQLFICECRPKSELPFRDAQNFCDLIRDSNCMFSKITIIPDMTAFNLIERGIVDLVVLGAHDVLLSNDMPVYFINTCGSSAIIEIAQKFNVEVIVVAEKGKFNSIESCQTASDDDYDFEYEISYGHESTIYDEYEFMSWAESQNIDTQNIGYDFCEFFRGMKLVCENDTIIAEDNNIRIKLIDDTK
ncbi:hypothetical protein OCV67_11760 [Porcipelethomonas ammoniilytica]|mgnify:FL=1|uniref:hypothetical protein n=1 Tax=Porcipelethomonas ammoniilytica TaxID=2981722 RepID=UPI00082127E2|nr:hypothetical protein [Porcipelethomonas ammoniilytica]MCU6720595.1 hypothetical protein [Porcipelethomonas ammoniilytica]SCJ18322.1 Initiation factor 2 subunit family [uncultured Ruminococcus sp.]